MSSLQRIRCVCVGYDIWRPQQCTQYCGAEWLVSLFCRITNYELLRSLVEMLSCDIHHYRVTMHHCKLSQLISINLWCVTTVLIIKNATVSTSQNVKDRSPANKYLRKIKVNHQTYFNLSTADVVCYSSATWWTELNDVRLIDGGS